MRNMTVGSDPEILIMNSYGVPVSMIGKLPYTKLDKLELRYGQLHVDNVALELNSIPATTSIGFIENHMNLLQEAQGFLQDNFGLYFNPKADADYAHESFDEYERQEFERSGCEPGFNIHTRKFGKPNIKLTTKRFAGGHIHIGYPDPNMERSIDLAGELELRLKHYIELNCNSKERFKFYGKWGEIRFTPYGFEYRVPDNFWLWKQEHMEVISEAVFSL